MDTSYLEYALKQHAYAMGQVVLATAHIEGMKAENEKAIQNGLTPPYGEEQFERAMESYAIDHNSVINAFTY
jgi:hypothetical protein|nr:MAG TPA: hypothetical protein [Caudoviricetes sp.]